MALQQRDARSVPFQGPADGARRGLTVIEILVSATLALIIIVAMVRLFANIGGGVSNARATLEMSSQLRLASNRLRRDLEGLTLPVRPWPSPADGQGYFEYVEGPGFFIPTPVTAPYNTPVPQPSPSRDANADGDVSAMPIDSLADNNMNSTPDYQEGLVDSSIGDIDDVLMFTSRNSEEPFVGKIQAFTVLPEPTGGFRVYQRNPSMAQQNFDGVSGNPTTVESPNAEIVWWTQNRFVDEGGVPMNTWNQGEEIFTTLHRRALLIRPDLNQFLDLDGDGNLDDTDGDMVPDVVGMGFIQAGSANGFAPLLKTFLNQNDISVRIEFRPLGSMNPQYLVLIANSLADLTQRENRFAHFPVILETQLGSRMFSFAPAGRRAFPHPLDLDPRSVTSLPRVVKSTETAPVDNAPPPTPVPNTPNAFESRTELGEDVILSNVVGFDVRGYDPRVAVRRNVMANPNVALVPGDPGYNPSLQLIGLGGFVDLGYDSTLTGMNATPLSADRTLGLDPMMFPGLPLLRTYDTWSRHYEADGIDQDPCCCCAIDQGTNGIDDDCANGVDDAGERETAPPYPVPLRGIKITMRVIELDTKQVRQASVVSDFIPE